MVVQCICIIRICEWRCPVAEQWKDLLVNLRRFWYKRTTTSSVHFHLVRRQRFLRALLDILICLHFKNIFTENEKWQMAYILSLALWGAAIRSHIGLFIQFYCQTYRLHDNRKARMGETSTTPMIKSFRAIAFYINININEWLWA